MFPFVTETWNPIGGRCPYGCIYCWSMGDKGLVKKYNMKKYSGSIYLVEKELKRKFKDDDFVFVQDMSDLLANCVPSIFIQKVINHIKLFPKTRFLLLTKNPQRYFEFLDRFPKNVVLGATIESDWNHLDISKAPPQSERMQQMMKLARQTNLPLFISIEPILDFDIMWVVNLKAIKPWAIAIGYDNYSNFLPEPPLSKTLRLIEELEKAGIKVFRKTIRKTWWEK